MVLSTEWAQVEVIDLMADSNGFGFNIVGGRSTGVVVKHIMPGCIADKDGRLQCGDHLLQIGAVNLRGYSSEQVATVLRQSGEHIRLLVARPIEPSHTDFKTYNINAPVVPTKVLTDPETLEQYLIESSMMDVYHPLIQSYGIEYEENRDNGNTELTVLPITNNTTEVIEHVLVHETPDNLPQEFSQLPEREIVKVNLRKNVYGLGVTVAGFVCEQEELSGIFIKSIIEGSCADLSGKIQVNDRIIKVDGQSLLDKTNHQSVEILKNAGIEVELVLERYLRGPGYEHLQVALSNNNEKVSGPQSPSATTLTWFPVPTNDETTNGIDPEPESTTTIDSNIFDPEAVTEPNIDELNSRLDEVLNINKDDLVQKWSLEIGEDKEIIVVDVKKLSGLGISLEGTVEVEGGQEVRPHHYIRSILPEGPVGVQGKLQAGDELLQVNECRLHGLKHTEVVNILKGLPSDVKLVCARDEGPRPLINLSQDIEGFEARKIISGSFHNLTSLIKAHSDGSINTSSTNTVTDHSLKSRKSRSLECVSGLAMWQDDEVVIQLLKGDSGLGFSILDYQDPIDPDGTVIVVRSLVPGGIAEKHGGIAAGDRVLSVNGINIKNATLDRAVQALKGAPKGIVRVGIAKPLTSHDGNSKSKSSSALNNAKHFS